MRLIVALTPLLCFMCMKEPVYQLSEDKKFQELLLEYKDSVPDNVYNYIINGYNQTGLDSNEAIIKWVGERKKNSGEWLSELKLRVMLDLCINADGYLAEDLSSSISKYLSHGSYSFDLFFRTSTYPSSKGLLLNKVAAIHSFHFIWEDEPLEAITAEMQVALTPIDKRESKDFFESYYSLVKDFTEENL